MFTLSPYSKTFTYHIVNIKLYTGMRKGEVLGLFWEDIDLENNIIKIRRNLVRKKDSNFELAPPKTNSSIRDIKIGDTLSKILKDEKLNQKKQKVKIGKWYKKTEYNWVCRKKDGSFVTHGDIDMAIAIINKDLNIDFNFHCLRHTHATLLLENGANIKDIQKRLGHSKITTTMDTYSHVTHKMESETVNILEGLRI
ncbi:site-specific integrase [Clostridioides difficile]